MIYDLTHRTLYHYAETARFARHLLHLLPRAREGQQVLDARLEIVPPPEKRFDEEDYFGNKLTTIALIAPHETLEITLRARIAREVEADGPRAATLVAVQEAPGFAEFTLPTALTGADAAIGDFARAATANEGDAFGAGLALMAAINRCLTYRPGVTSVATTASAALARQEGVCQDYAHVMLAALRALGLPCRYVSGYLRSGDTTRGAEQSHAWVSLWVGPEGGWVDFDPTNDRVAGSDHVTLAWGRDFEDVSPVRGVIRGGGRHRPEVEVVMLPAPGS